MIFELKVRKDKKIESFYKRAVKEIDNFFRINWKINKPKIFLMKDREAINELRGDKTEDWVVGWTRYLHIFILDNKNYEKESRHKYSDQEYFSLIKHELSHCFFQVYSGIIDNPIKPKWLSEGVAIYLSGQNKIKKKPIKFSEFLEFYNQGGRGIYKESGFFIEFLIKRYGKRRLLNLIKFLKKIKSEKDFNKKFKGIYGFNLNYKEINKRFNVNLR
ncbi:MAG: hypothetical protein WC584_04820 [Candidatus Pacearchaeota archaeon]